MRYLSGLLVLGLLMSGGCFQMPNPTQNMGSQNTASGKDVGPGEEIPAERMGYKRKIESILEEYRHPGGTSMTAFPTAYYASNSMMNGQALYTGALTFMIAKANVYGTYLEIIAHSPDKNEQGKPWVEVATAYYEKQANGDKTMYAVNGSFILAFEKGNPGNQGYIDIFMKNKLP